MKIYRISGFAFFILFLILSCNSSQDKSRIKITELENTLHKDSFGINHSMIITLLDAYKKYVKSYPEDTLSPDYLYKAAMLSMNNSRPQDAIGMIDQLIKNYPTYKKVPDCLFIKGFIYDNNLKDFVNAKKNYEEFLKKYPTHPFAVSARSSLKFLGKSPEEILKELEKNKNIDSAVTLKK